LRSPRILLRGLLVVRSSLARRLHFSFGSLHPEQEQQIIQLAAAKLQTANASLLEG
jgi:hypothetical protein